jgi:hypothetical protein
MNPRDYLHTHPIILTLAREMRSAGLQPDTISRIVDEALKPFIYSERTRGEITRIIRRTLKHSESEGIGTIESDGTEDAGHSIPG